MHHLKGSEDRLWRLIEERARPGADVKAIDGRVWDLFGEDWAVMFTDLAGFSRHVEAFGILHFLQIIWEHLAVLTPCIEKNDGILIKQEADSLLILFRRPDSALRCAIAMQQALQTLNVGRKPEDLVLLCVGIGYGRILRIGDVDVYGKEVNAASKLGEDTAKAHEILITDAAKNALTATDGVRFEALDVEVAGSAKNHRVLY
jgi:adenylate cyclase